MKKLFCALLILSLIALCAIAETDYTGEWYLNEVRFGEMTLSPSLYGKDVTLSLNADGTGPGSRAGAGLAAYHAAQAQSQAAQANADPAVAQSNAARTPAAQPAAPDPARTVPPLTARSGEEQGAATGGPAASFSIPPLTAGDLRG